MTGGDVVAIEGMHGHAARRRSLILRNIVQIYWVIAILI
jgi:hypothetical protein